MIEHTTWDPVGRLVTELRSDPAVAAIAGQNPTTAPRVRGQHEAPGDARSDDRGEALLRAHIVVATLGLPPHPQVPLLRDRHAVRCYGRTPEEATALYVAASRVVHAKGPRRAGAQAIYVSHDDTGGDYSTDPDTLQPLYTFVVETVATTQVVA